jgi:hypothetical protein
MATDLISATLNLSTNLDQMMQYIQMLPLSLEIVFEK